MEEDIYPMAEHWMMAEKARLFDDIETRQKILKSSSPGGAKQLGREVRGFNQAIWEDKRFDIVVKGNIEKFSQNQTLEEYLINTKKANFGRSQPCRFNLGNCIGCEQ